jgi:23S rRNA A2030 N6-methylase RlmJ
MKQMKKMKKKNNQRRMSYRLQAKMRVQPKQKRKRLKESSLKISNRKKK